MNTKILEGTITALSSIAHNGSERNGITTQLRREKFVQPDMTVEKVPVISGNAVRGILRDIGMLYMCKKLGYGVNEGTGEVKGLSLQALYFLFSGGSLTKGSKVLSVDYFRKVKKTIPLIGLFGGAAGNQIMPGKMKIGKLIPICQETRHLIPERFRPERCESIWEYCQTEFYTRRDDNKNDAVRKMLAPVEQKEVIETKKESTPQQMMYEVETLCAGTQFYWKVVLEDVTDIEMDAFLTTLAVFSKSPYLGGRSGTGNGEVALKVENWLEIDSRMRGTGKKVDLRMGQKYENHLNNNKDEIVQFLKEFE